MVRQLVPSRKHRDSRAIVAAGGPGVVVAGGALYVATRDGVGANLVDVPRDGRSSNPRSGSPAPIPSRSATSALEAPSSSTAPPALTARPSRWRSRNDPMVPPEVGDRRDCVGRGRRSLSFDGWSSMDYRAVVKSPDGRTTSEVERNGGPRSSVTSSTARAWTWPSGASAPPRRVQRLLPGRGRGRRRGRDRRDRRRPCLRQLPGLEGSAPAGSSVPVWEPSSDRSRPWSRLRRTRRWSGSPLA